MTHHANFLAIDLGSSSGRVFVGQWDGGRFQIAELHRFPNGPIDIHGRMHWDALRLWSEVQDGLGRYAAQFDTPLEGIGVDTWGVDFALLDKAGELLNNPRHYRDPRTNGMIDAVLQRIPREELFAQTGIQFLPINTLYQLYSMAQADDPRLQAAETLLMMPDLFNYWMTGTRAVEYTDATTTQCLLAHERRWATEMLGQLGIPSHFLPPIVQPGALLGELRPEIVRAAGLRAAPPVIAPGGHDTASAIAAIPALDADSVYISSGTWSLVGVEITEPVTNARACALNMTNEGGVAGTIRLLRNVAGLWLLQECRRIWQRGGREYSWEELLDLAEQATPFHSLIDPDAADFLSPADMPEAIRAFCRRAGQPAPESPGAVVRCCLESLALRYRWVVEALEELTGRRLETIRIVGGGCRNRLLCQWTADACGRPVVTGPVEATVLGNILVQAIAAGHLRDIAEGRRAIAASVEQQVYEPRASGAWDEAYGRMTL
jgi:rhamnulokinase